MTARRAVLLVAALTAVSARASTTYPAVVRDHLALAKTPSCKLCHTTVLGGKGTTNAPFGRSIRNAGAIGGSQDSKLLAALDVVQAQRIDSDGDGAPDIAELKAGTDPNVKPSSPIPVEPLPPPPAYGCGADVAPSLFGGLGALGLALLFGFGRRREPLSR